MCENIIQEAFNRTLEHGFAYPANKHTVTVTRILENMAGTTFQEPGIAHIEGAGNHLYAVFWGGRFTTYAKSRKDANTWVANQIMLRRNLLERN